MVKKDPLFIVNPQITFKSDELISYEEGAYRYLISLQKLKTQLMQSKLLDYDGKKGN